MLLCGIWLLISGGWKDSGKLDDERLAPTHFLDARQEKRGVLLYFELTIHRAHIGSEVFRLARCQ